MLETSIETMEGSQSLNPVLPFHSDYAWHWSCLLPSRKSNFTGSNRAASLPSWSEFGSSRSDARSDVVLILGINLWIQFYFCS